jgi:hypothetical protein
VEEVSRGSCLNQVAKDICCSWWALRADRRRRAGGLRKLVLGEVYADPLDFV